MKVITDLWDGPQFIWLPVIISFFWPPAILGVAILGVIMAAED